MENELDAVLNFEFVDVTDDHIVDTRLLNVTLLGG